MLQCPEGLWVVPFAVDVHDFRRSIACNLTARQRQCTCCLPCTRASKHKNARGFLPRQSEWIPAANRPGGPVTNRKCRATPEKESFAKVSSAFGCGGTRPTRKVLLACSTEHAEVKPNLLQQ